MGNNKPTRLVLWTILIILSTVILRWPVSYGYHYQAVQALSAIDHVFIFGIIYTAWIILLLILARKGNFGSNAVLVSIFGFVHGGFFIINAPYITAASFDPSGVSYVNYIMTHSKFILGDPQWAYFEFPANAVLGALVTHITGLSIFVASKVILTAGCVLLPLAGYSFYYRFVGKSFLSLLGVILAMLGSIYLIALGQFRPGTLGLILLAPFLVLVSIEGPNMSKSRAKVFLLLLVFATVILTHFISSATLIFLILGIFTYQRIIKKEIISFNIIILILTLGIVWWLYESLYVTKYVADRYLAFMSEPSSLSFVLAFRKAQTLVGGEVPIWASLVRIFWTLFIFVLPCLMALIVFLSLKKRKVEIEIGMLMGLTAMTILMFVADQGGDRSIPNFFQFGTFILPLILLRTFASNDLNISMKIPVKVTKYVEMASLAFVVAIAFPTFIAHNPSVNTQIMYDREYATFRFIQTRIASSNSINLFCDADTLTIYNYFIPEAKINVFPYAPDIVKNKPEFIAELPLYIGTFNKSDDYSIFIYSPRISHRSFIQLNVSELDPIWDNVKSALASNDRIYTNGFDSIDVNLPRL